MFKFKSVSTWFKFKCGMIDDSRSWFMRISIVLAEQWWYAISKHQPFLPLLMSNVCILPWQHLNHPHPVHGSIEYEYWWISKNISLAWSNGNDSELSTEFYHTLPPKWLIKYKQWSISSIVVKPLVSIFPYFPHGPSLWDGPVGFATKPPRLHAAWRSLHNARCCFLRWPSGTAPKRVANANITNNL